MASAGRGSIEQGDSAPLPQGPQRPIQLALADGKIGRQLAAAAEAEEAAMAASAKARKQEAELAKAEESKSKKAKAEAIALAAADAKALKSKAEEKAKGKKDKEKAEVELAAADAKSSKAAKRAADLKAAAKKVEVELASAETKAGKGGWVVQVGAFKSETDAKARISQVNKIKTFKGRSGQVTPASSGQFRARFHGFSSDDAKAACKAVDGPCMAIKA
jgi:uncharacterized membrane protein YqiK